MNAEVLIEVGTLVGLVMVSALIVLIRSYRSGRLGDALSSDETDKEEIAEYLEKEVEPALKEFERELQSTKDELEDIETVPEELRNEIDKIDRRLSALRRQQATIGKVIVELHTNGEDEIDEEEFRERAGIEEMDRDLVD